MGKTVQDHLVDTLEELGQDELKKFKSKLNTFQVKEGYNTIPRGRLEKAEVLDLVQMLIGYYKEDYAVKLTVELLTDINMMDLAERLLKETGVEITCDVEPLLSTDPLAEGATGGRQENLREDSTADQRRRGKCELCPTEEDPPEEIQPEIAWSQDGNQETYRVHLPRAGSFRCSETELGFEVRAAMTVQYGYDSWDQYLSTAQKQQWMVAGPLFEIQVEPAEAVTTVHLPHFLCLMGGEADISQMRIAHFIDGRLTLELPTQVKPFHAVLENPGFSLLGVLWRKIQAKCQAKIHSLALLYRALMAANTTLHLYLIPNDHSLKKAVDNQESQCSSKRIPKPSPTKPLKFGSCCAVSSSSQLEVMPEELEFYYRDPKQEQPYLEIYSRDMQERLELSLVETSEREFIWKAFVRQEDLTHFVPYPKTDSHFIDHHREQLIQRVTAVDGILDLLHGPVLDTEQYQSVRAEKTNQEKMRKLYELVPSWNTDCKDQFYRALKDKHRHLVEELEGK